MPIRITSYNIFQLAPLYIPRGLLSLKNPFRLKTGLILVSCLADLRQAITALVKPIFVSLEDALSYARFVTYETVGHYDFGVI